MERLLRIIIIVLVALWSHLLYRMGYSRGFTKGIQDYDEMVRYRFDQILEANKDVLERLKQADTPHKEED